MTCFVFPTHKWQACIIWATYPGQLWLLSWFDLHNHLAVRRFGSSRTCCVKKHKHTHALTNACAHMHFMPAYTVTTVKWYFILVFWGNVAQVVDWSSIIQMVGSSIPAVYILKVSLSNILNPNGSSVRMGRLCSENYSKWWRWWEMCSTIPANLPISGVFRTANNI